LASILRSPGPQAIAKTSKAATTANKPAHEAQSCIPASRLSSSRAFSFTRGVRGRGVLGGSYATSRITLSRWGRSGLRFGARAGSPSQHMGSVHKGSPCRILRVLTPLLTPPRAQLAAARATTSEEMGLDKPILQPQATPRNRCRRIVAPKVAGSSPVGHPVVCRGNAVGETEKR
jgi:hypothetical protein